MTTTKQRPKIRPGDLAYVAGAGLGNLPLFRITKIETDSDGNITVYHLTAQSGPGHQGEPVPASRVTAVFSNVLNQQE